MPIKLQTAAGAFDPIFLKRLARLEQEMAQLDIDAERFVISKSMAAAPNLALIYRSTPQIDYTVFVDDEHFTVSLPDDLTFLKYFCARCIAPEEAARPQPRRESLMRRFGRWLVTTPPGE